MATAFKSGPHLTSVELVQQRETALLETTTMLRDEHGVIPELLVVTSAFENPGIRSYILSLQQHGPRVGVEVTVRNCPNDNLAQRRVEEANDQPGATLVMVPLKDRDREPALLRANKREIEGLQPDSRFSPSTPQAMVDLLEHALGHSLTALADPERDLAVIGKGRSVGTPLIHLLAGMGITGQLVIDRSNAQDYGRLRDKRYVLTAVGRASIVKARHLAGANMVREGDDMPESMRRYGIDAGVTSVGKRLRGDIAPSTARRVPDFMYTPPTNATGPLNALTMLKRTTQVTMETLRIDPQTLLSTAPQAPGEQQSRERELIAV